MYKIPLFNLNYGKEEEEAIIETLRSKWISTGPKCIELEEKFSTLLGSKFAISLSNCTSALHLSLLALEINSDSEVIVPSLTFAATANAVKYVNAKAVFCDIISPENPTIDPAQLETLITNKTKAIIVMHYAGFPCDLKRILNIAKKHNIKIIEDACHAPLSEYNDGKIGTFGDIGCFSFFSNKNISTGEGGIVITDNKKLHDKIKLLRSHGMSSLSYDRHQGHATRYDILELGYNYRMDDIRASLALVQLKKLENDILKRIKIRQAYLELLSDIDEVIIPFLDVETFSSNYIFPLVLKNSDSSKRDSLRAFLEKNSIQTSVHYPSVHLFSIYYKDSVSLPKTEYFSDNEISLPMHGQLTEENLSFITNSIKDGLIE
jgi:dTDP-4-amino-4,6-dideoxygalactose transaminase